jgi:hypothetical protein
MEDIDSMASLRKILAKSPPKKKMAPIMTPSNQPAAFVPSPTSALASPTTPIFVPHSPSTSILQYPSAHVSDCSPESATDHFSSSIKLEPNSPTGSPKSAAVSTPPSFKNFFKSFKGRSAWDADDDEFNSARKYSIATLKKVESIAARPLTVPGHGSVPYLEQPARNMYGSSLDTMDHVTPADSPLKREFFKSFRGRSAFDVDEDEYDVRRPYSTATLLKDKASITLCIAPSARRSPSPYPLSPPNSAGSASSSCSKLNGGSLFKSFRGRSPFDANDDKFDLHRPYTFETLKSSLPSALEVSGESSEKPTSDARKVSWVDQATNHVSSDNTPEQTTLGSKDDAESVNTGSTLSLTLTFVPDPPSPPRAPSPSPLQTPLLRNLDGYKTIRKSEGKLMSATLAAARQISPHKGSIWDPEDDEWMEMDANKVVNTFKASYKAPIPQSRQMAKALSYIGTSIQDTVKSVLFSPSKKANAEQLQQEERFRDQIEELRNTYFCNPKGDLCDEVMKQVLLQDRSGTFIPSPSPRNMHIIDLEAYFKSDDPLIEHAQPRLCDAVATVLSHTSRKCLEAFLNPAIKEFIYRRELDNNKGGLILIVRRFGNVVIAGAYCTFGFYYQWKLYVKSTVSITGQWHEVFATLKPGLMNVNDGVPEWDTINHDASELQVDIPKQTSGSPRKVQLSPSKKTTEVSDKLGETNPKFMLYQSRVMAKYLLWDIWYKFENLWEVRAIWEADGDVGKVRLTRALVGCGDEDKEE